MTDNNKVTNIFLSGVGGQGTILASNILAEVFLKAGYDVKKAEVHGMAQRGGDVTTHLTQGYVSVYVPTTPNPTSGFFLMMPESEVIELDMSVDDALKYIISMGVVTPDNRPLND